MTSAICATWIHSICGDNEDNLHILNIIERNDSPKNENVMFRSPQNISVFSQQNRVAAFL